MTPAVRASTLGVVHARASLIALGLLVGATACEPGLVLGSSCVRTSQCNEPLACVVGRCRVECRTHRDCPLGSHCTLAGDAIGSCRTDDERDCAADAECPIGTGCEETCRARCAIDADCAGTVCVPSAGAMLCAEAPEATWSSADAGAPDSGPRADAGLAATGIVINEVDYDTPGVDALEFVELYNAGPVAIARGTSYSLSIDRGAAGTLTHSGSLPALAPGEFAVYGDPLVTRAAPAGHSVASFLTELDGPDDLPATVTLTLEVAGLTTDAVAWGLPAPTGTVGGIWCSSTDSDTEARAFARIPDGVRTGDASVDFVVTARPTPAVAGVWPVGIR